MGVFFFKVLRGAFKVHSSKNRKKVKVHSSKDRKKNEEVRQEQHETSRPADTPAPARVRQEQPRTRASRPADSLRYYGWSWPRVVGLIAREAERIITRDCPGVYCEVASVNQLLTMCYRSARVRLVVDRYDRVVKVPRVG
ncbi:hypothetical protein BS78_03G337000 [Paspalum vaginatum]|nr:hypothetical protein BS78_03G337000 [Paspalum vaginatum]